MMDTILDNNGIYGAEGCANRGPTGESSDWVPCNEGWDMIDINAGHEGLNSFCQTLTYEVFCSPGCVETTWQVVSSDEMVNVQIARNQRKILNEMIKLPAVDGLRDENWQRNIILFY